MVCVIPGSVSDEEEEEVFVNVGADTVDDEVKEGPTEDHVELRDDVGVNVATVVFVNIGADAVDDEVKEGPTDDHVELRVKVTIVVFDSWDLDLASDVVVDKTSVLVLYAMVMGAVDVVVIGVSTADWLAVIKVILTHGADAVEVVRIAVMVVKLAVLTCVEEEEDEVGSW